MMLTNIKFPDFDKYKKIYFFLQNTHGLKNLDVEGHSVTSLLPYSSETCEDINMWRERK